MKKSGSLQAISLYIGQACETAAPLQKIILALQALSMHGEIGELGNSLFTKDKLAANLQHSTATVCAFGASIGLLLYGELRSIYHAVESLSSSSFSSASTEIGLTGLGRMFTSSSHLQCAKT